MAERKEPSSEAGAVLPAGVVPHDAPLTRRDVVIADPADQAALDTILYRAVCETRATMEAGARLYIVIGEFHDMPTHRMAQAGLLDNLAASLRTGDAGHGPPLYAYEFPRNHLQFVTRRHYHLPLEEKARTGLHEHDALGHHFAQAILATSPFPYAPQSLSRIFHSCLRHKIPLILADAARDETTRYLCPSDELSTNRAQELYEGLDLEDHKIEAEEVRGAVIRNAVMARRVAAAAETHKADTVVLGTGAAHLGGEIAWRLAYETSVTAFLKQEIRPQDKVLPVLFSLEDSDYTAENFAPPALWRENPETLIIRGASERAYDDEESQGLEEAFIYRLGESYRAIASFVPSRFQAPPLPSRKAVRTTLERLICQAAPP